MADLIPSEIWLDHIFIKLSVKSLLRCKLVCRAWNRLISDPEFVRTHLRLHQHQRVLLRLWSSERDYHSVDTITGDAVKLNLAVEDVSIIGSSDGLLCGRVTNAGKDRLAIWNPSTGEFKLISEGPLYDSYPDICHFGFCYDSSVDDGNVVLLPRRPDPLMKPKIDIYSIKSDSWKIVEQIQSPFGLDGLEPVRRGCGTNGSIYWLVNNELCHPNFVDILVFNIKTNNCRKVQLPRRWGSEDPTQNDLTVLGSRLGLSQSFSNDRFMVWSLKEGETEEWIKLIDLNLTFLIITSGCFLLPEPLCLTRNDKVLMLCQVDEDDEDDEAMKFFLYDPVSKETGYLSIRGISNGSPITMVAYVESLVSLASISQTVRN